MVNQGVSWTKVIGPTHPFLGHQPKFRKEEIQKIPARHYVIDGRTGISKKTSNCQKLSQP